MPERKPACMSLPRVLVTRKLPADVEARLKRDYAPLLNEEDRLFSAEELAARAKDMDAVLATVTDKLDAAAINALPGSVRIIATFSVGYDHINVAAAAKRSITVTNTPGVLTQATADITLLLILGAARGAGWGEAMIRQKTWQNWAPSGPLGTDVTGKRLGILGMGRIGQAVAVRARAFGMEIHYHNRSRLSEAGEQGAHYHESPEALFAQSDILSINCASTPQTRGLINARTLALLPEGAIVVNSARGDIVDDEALIAALKSGKVAAAGLDVYAGEPNIHPGYRGLSNTFLLPHLGSATRETRNAMGFCALDNLDAFFAGKEPPNPVTP